MKSNMLNRNHLRQLSIFVTLLVSKVDTSKLVIAPHSENMLFILVTLLVSKLLTSRSFKNHPPWNIANILVTLDVSRYSSPSITAL